jgi:3-oxoacyl-[acyl-carrier-protein] synthase II
MTAQQAWAIAGTGARTSIGSGVSEVFDALCASRRGLAPLRAFDTSRMRTRHAFEADVPGLAPDAPGRATALLCLAVAEAVERASLSQKALSQAPVLVGTGLRELRSMELRRQGRADFDLADLHFGRALRDRFGVHDTHTFAGACSASLYALGLAADLLAADRADTVIVAGVDTVTMSMYGLLDRVQHPAPDAVRPFDRERRGQILGEGAAAVVLRKDGPAPTVLRSVALHCDARHLTAPDAEGIAETIRQAHERAGIKPEEVDLVYAQGTGTKLNDTAEAQALVDVFNPVVEDGGPLVTAVEGMTGHTSGCSGLLGTVIAAECLRTGRVPATVGLREPIDAVAGFRFSRGGPGRSRLATAQVHAVGFGGVNAVAVLGKVG